MELLKLIGGAIGGLAMLTLWVEPWRETRLMSKRFRIVVLIAMSLFMLGVIIFMLTHS